jgi:hypothetical protein
MHILVRFFNGDVYCPVLNLTSFFEAVGGDNSLGPLPALLIKPEL